MNTIRLIHLFSTLAVSYQLDYKTHKRTITTAVHKRGTAQLKSSSVRDNPYLCTNLHKWDYFQGGMMTEWYDFYELKTTWAAVDIATTVGHY